MKCLISESGVLPTRMRPCAFIHMHLPAVTKKTQNEWYRYSDQLHMALRSFLTFK